MFESKYLKDNIENIQHIMSIPVLKDFETSNLGKLLTISKIRQYEDGETIIQEGEPALWLYFLISGRVQIQKNKEEVAILRRKGDVFGEMGLIQGPQTTATAIAVGKTTLLTTEASQIDEFAGDDRVAFGYMLYRVLCEVVTDRLKSTTDDLIRTKEELAACKATP
ncbi:cyclic nucleotide-binding domain-containing protein [Desulfobacterales bacterium HSG17]|nr:cyclic nucleotide-binding domain-containing protein [Desulfobacterales bacterium HSG17]